MIWNGTLANTLESMAYVANEILKSRISNHSRWENFKYYSGKGRIMLIRRCLKDAGDPELTHYEEVRRIYRKNLMKIQLYKVVPYEGIKEMLKELKKRGMKLAVCSNKPHVAAVKVIEKMFDGYFDFVIGQSDSIRRKPAPDGPLKAASEFGVSPSECMYVGDNQNRYGNRNCCKNAYGRSNSGDFVTVRNWRVMVRKKWLRKPQDLLYICEEWKND